MTPKVSILIPTYARVIELQEALHCALNQNYENFNVIVLNDNPRQKLFCNDPRVIIHNESIHYPTLGAKRNALVEKADSEFIVWLDDDDLIMPWHVSKLVKPYTTFNFKSCIVRSYVDYRMHSDNLVTSIPRVVIAHGVTREDALKYKFASDMDSGEDQVFVSKIPDNIKVLYANILNKSYIYRWNNGTYHISGRGWINDGHNFRKDADYRMDNGLEPIGDILLNPSVRHDYIRTVLEFNELK
jgi:glycosyltransferase involved in cell wall biosynthesis